MIVSTAITGDYILSIDAGTQSIRAVLFDLNGNIKDIVKTPIEPYYSVLPGYAEQDPEYYWKMLCFTCRRLFNKTKIPRRSIKGVTLTTQRDTMINLDKDGKPLYFLPMMRDITDEKKNEEELRIYRERLEELVEERTAQLAEINARLRQEMIHHQQADEQL